MPGTVVRVRGIKRYLEPKTGKWYCYHRATGKRINEEFGSAAFFARLAELEAEAKGIAEAVARPGTLKALILDYKLTDNFRSLAPRTKADYEKVFVFLEPLWPAQLSSFTTPQIVSLRNKWRQTRGRRSVNYARAVLSILFNYAVELGLVASNPVRNVKQIRRPLHAAPVNRPWTLAERHVAIQHLPPQFKLPFMIGLYSGMREGDIIRLPRNAFAGGAIKIKTAKRGVWIDVPILPELQQALDEAPDHDAITLCVNSRGKPWTVTGFSTGFRKVVKKLEEHQLVNSGLTFHGLRHTVATVLAEAGANHEDIAAMLGHRTSEMAAHYAREADRSKRTRAAIKGFDPLGADPRRSPSRKEK
jgi:integrase